jgi:hypothetical protein
MKRPQTYALDGKAIGIGIKYNYNEQIKKE